VLVGARDFADGDCPSTLELKIDPACATMSSSMSSGVPARSMKSVQSPESSNVSPAGFVITPWKWWCSTAWTQMNWWFFRLDHRLPGWDGRDPRSARAIRRGGRPHLRQPRLGSAREDGWLGTIAILEMAGAALAVALTVSLAGYFTETWHWLRVLLERDAFLRVLLERDAFKVWSAIALGSVGGFGHRFLRPSRLVARGKHPQDPDRTIGPSVSGVRCRPGWTMCEPPPCPSGTPGITQLSRTRVDRLRPGGDTASVQSSGPSSGMSSGVSSGVSSGYLGVTSLAIRSR
jgi:hypothetical protein